MNLDELQTNINATLAFAKAVSAHPNSRTIEVVFRTDKGELLCDLGYMAEKICALWEDFEDGNVQFHLKP